MGMRATRTPQRVAGLRRPDDVFKCTYSKRRVATPVSLHHGVQTVTRSASHGVPPRGVGSAKRPF